MSDLTGARWHKSTRSGNAGDCVEVAENLPGIVAVRDTKNRDGGTLTSPTPNGRRSSTASRPASSTSSTLLRGECPAVLLLTWHAVLETLLILRIRQ